MEWKKIVAVLSHPRCSGCHVEDDRPRWCGGSLWGRESACIQCSARSGWLRLRQRCYALRVVPFREQFQRVAWRAGCSEVASRTCRNGMVRQDTPRRYVRRSRTWREMADERSRQSRCTCGTISLLPGDGLRAKGREPAPGSAEQTYQALERWSAAGAPCPG